MATQNFRREGGGEPKADSVLKQKAEMRRRRLAALEEESLRRRRVVPGPVDTPQSADAAVALHKDFLNVVASAPTGAVEGQFTRTADRGLRVYFAGGTELVSTVFDDFITAGPTNGTGGWQHSVSGTNAFVFASSTGVDSTEKCQGVWAMSIGTDAGAGRSGIHLTQGGILFGIGTAFEMEMRVAFSALSDATDEYRAHAGFFDSAASAAMPVDAACFMYRRTTEGNFWACVTSSNSNADPTSPTNTTITTTSVAIVASVFQVLKVVVNSAGTSVGFYIDGALVATHSTNIPTGAGRQTGPGIRAYKTASAGTNNRSMLADYAAVRMSGGAR